MPNQRSPDIDFYFQSFSALEYRTDHPILCIAFENQTDRILTNNFPEVEKLRSMLDSVRDRSDETVSIFGGTRNDKVIPLGIVYLRQPWRRRRRQSRWDIDSINFYRELWERTVLATTRVRGAGLKEFTLILPSMFRPQNIRNDRQQEKRLEKFVRTITEAVVYANHSLDEFITENVSPLIESVTLTYFGDEDREVNNFFQRSIGEGEAIGEATGLVRQLTMLPANFKTPTQFVYRAIGASIKFKSTRAKIWRLLKKHNFSSRTKVSCLYGKEGIERFGFGLVSAVSRGSSHQPVFLKIHYKPLTERQKPVKRVVVIGKGITFDTGGTIAKNDDDLLRMNYDMAGAAMAINLVKLADTMNLPVDIVALVPIVENANGPEAVRPKDIFTAYNGKTVEIVDTDAEGRLVLSDAVAYSERHLRADCTITIGTLGDMSDMAPDLLKIGLGNLNLRKKVMRAENNSNEKIFSLPSIEHLNEVDNEHLGDISDLVNWPAGGHYHSSAFVFIYNFFTEEKPEWIFVDPSAVFEGDADTYGAGPGFGLKFIWHIIKQYA